MENAISRRGFNKLSIASLCLLFGNAVMAAGCGIDDIASFAPIGAIAFAGILTLLGDPGTSLIVLAIKAAFADIPADIAAYKSANPPPAGTFEKIDLVLSELLDNFQQFLATASIANPIASLVAMLAGVILSAVSGFIQKFFPQSASLPNTKVSLRKKFTLGRGIAITYKPEAMSTYDFKQAWNKVAREGGRPDVQLQVGLLEHITRK